MSFLFLLIIDTTGSNVYIASVKDFTLSTN